jgi:ornithine cyclodeaminase/alanine dehydrogenase-like protein (mu-crystallin family)
MSGTPMAARKLRVLSRRDVQDLLTWDDAIRLQAEAFALFSGGQVVMPVKTLLQTERPKAHMLFMPALIAGAKGFGVKYVADFHENLERGLPHLLSAVLLMDGETGRPVALLEGAYLTDMRTGASAGLAAQLLARGDATAVTVFGAGGTARPSLEAVCHVRDIERVWVVGRSADRLRRFVEEMRGTGRRVPPRIEATTDRRTAVHEADIIIAATNSPEPVFDGCDLRAGTHISSVGNVTGRELDTETIRRARVLLDSREGCLKQARDIYLPLQEGAVPPEHLQDEIGQVVLGERPRRRNRDEITLFKSLGIAIQDLVTGLHVLREAERLGRGVLVDFA